MRQELDDNMCSEQFADVLSEILRDNLLEAQEEDAQTLADQCVREEREAVDEVEVFLARIELDLDRVRDSARDHKTQELVQEYARREPDAVTMVQELLAGNKASMDALMADALGEKLDDIARIERLTTLAESRRSASLREIDRRRAVFGETLRRSVQAVRGRRVRSDRDDASTRKTRPLMSDRKIK